MAKAKPEKAEDEQPYAEQSMKRIAALDKALDEADAELSEAEAHVRVCRQNKEKLIQQLRRTIKEERTPNLFSPGVVVSAEDVSAAKKQAEETAAKEEAGKADAKAAARGGDAWRKVSIAELGLKDKTAEALKANVPPLDTLGALSDWKAGGKEYDAVPNLPAAQAKAVGKAIAAYFKKQKPEGAK